jgi:hypothetical protein
MWGALSDTGWVCQSQSLLILDGAVVLRLESRETHHIWMSQIQNSPNLEDQFPYLYPTGTGKPDYTPQHWVTFPLSPNARRCAMKLFHPASTQGSATNMCEWCWYMGSVYRDKSAGRATRIRDSKVKLFPLLRDVFWWEKHWLWMSFLYPPFGQSWRNRKSILRTPCCIQLHTHHKQRKTSS